MQEMEQAKSDTLKLHSNSGVTPLEGRGLRKPRRPDRNCLAHSFLPFSFFYCMTFTENGLLLVWRAIAPYAVAGRACLLGVFPWSLHCVRELIFPPTQPTRGDTWCLSVTASCYCGLGVPWPLNRGTSFNWLSTFMILNNCKQDTSSSEQFATGHSLHSACALPE